MKPPRYCHWHIPQTHFLEAWSDTRAFDGTVSIVQPLIQPLYANRSAHEVIEAMIAAALPEQTTIWFVTIGGNKS